MLLFLSKCYSLILSGISSYRFYKYYSHYFHFFDFSSATPILTSPSPLFFLHSFFQVIIPCFFLVFRLSSLLYLILDVKCFFLFLSFFFSLFIIARHTIILSFLHSIFLAAHRPVTLCSSFFLFNDIFLSFFLLINKLAFLLTLFSFLFPTFFCLPFIFMSIKFFHYISFHSNPHFFLSSLFFLDAFPPHPLFQFLVCLSSFFIFLSFVSPPVCNGRM
ncbi:unnamed protein product [Acanthosepion pharaonis]|uniref:Uncharacterized protein n=1 Tax=Acanthosepion pharaonis TaxID=158019 RepID=A0A812AM92_ACAPH|nr:unnamed protein product [Sepia pharaonis]